jgi:hypothetical protein
MLNTINAECHLCCVTNKPLMVSVVMLNVVMLSVVMLNVVAPSVCPCKAYPAKSNVWWQGQIPTVEWSTWKVPHLGSLRYLEMLAWVNTLAYYKHFQNYGHKMLYNIGPRTAAAAGRPISGNQEKPECWTILWKNSPQVRNTIIYRKQYLIQKHQL